MSLFAKARKAKENKKGFTLVELIVVLVILAILAAILVPALLGWIDEAKKKQYVLEARSIYMAAQAVADEKYAEDATALTVADLNTASPRIITLSDVKFVRFIDGTVKTKVGDDKHAPFTITGLGMFFQSQDGTYVGARLTGGTWEVDTSIEETKAKTGGVSSDLPGTPDTEKNTAMGAGA